MTDDPRSPAIMKRDARLAALITQQFLGEGDKGAIAAEIHRLTNTPIDEVTQNDRP